MQKRRELPLWATFGIYNGPRMCYNDPKRILYIIMYTHISTGGASMTKETINRIHKLYGIVLSIVAVAAGILFIVSAYGLYTDGKAADVQPYTLQTIGAAFARISVPVYLCLMLVIGGFILDAVLPREKKKTAADKNLPLILSRLRAKTDLSQCDLPLCNAIEKQQKGRRLHAFVSGSLLGLASVLFLAYACNPNNWVPVGGDLNGSMIKAFFALLICLALPCLSTIFTVFYCKRSLNKEIDLMRQASAAAPLKGGQPSQPKNRQLAVCITRYAILAVSLVFIAYGLCNGGTADVLAKAATICTECVGLG